MPRKKPAPAPPITVVVDTREQTPWEFTLPTVVATVPTGADYTVQGFESEIGIERKSLQDLVGSLTQGRERFMRSLGALRERTHRLLVVEADFGVIVEGYYRSQVAPSSIVGSLASIMADGVPVFCAGNAHLASLFAERFLVKAHKRVMTAREAT